MKKKAKEQIASGLLDVGLALPEADIAEELALISEEPKGKNDMDVEQSESTKARKKTKQGVIGEGKASTLSNKQRMQVL